MTYLSNPIQKFIDYIDDPADTFEQYIEKARRHGFRCVFADLDQYEQGLALLMGTDIILAGAIDFPDGILSLEEKLRIFELYASKGFREIDYVLNQRAIESRDYATIEREMTSIADFCRGHGITDKAIVEMCKLDGDEAAKRRVCEIAKRAQPCFLKTSTGRGTYGAKLNDVRLMHEILKRSGVRIKAAGGIRTYKQTLEFIKAGADVLGATAGIEIVEGEIHDSYE